MLLKVTLTLTLTLLSKEDMKQFNVKTDMQNDTAEILGKEVNLDTTSSGHYCIALQSCEIPFEKVCFAVSEKSGDEKQKIVLKLHKQFAYPSADSLKSLMQHADAFGKEIDQLIDQVTNNCVTCKCYKKTPPRPVVCLHMATQFNEVVAMDLKHFRRGIYFLHLIDSLGLVWQRSLKVNILLLLYKM